jgi:hypothetical protein
MKRMPLKPLLLRLLLICGLPSFALADVKDWQSSGHVKIQALASENSKAQGALDLRGVFNRPAQRPQGVYIGLDLALSAQTPLPVEASTQPFLPLQTEQNTGDSQIAARLDRAFIGQDFTQHSQMYGYQLGRQVVTFGDGQVFNPLDFINPFAPLQIDRSYKPGVDALKAYWNPSAASQVSAYWIARREAQTDHHTGQLDTQLLSYRLQGEVLQLTGLLARDFNQIKIGLGMNGPWSEASWALNLLAADYRDSGVGVSGLFSLSSATALWEKSLYWTAEYFYNALGEGARQVDLTAELSRGQVQSASLHNFAVTGQWQASPLTSVSASLILAKQPDTESLQIALVHSLTNQQTLTLAVSANTQSQPGLSNALTAYGQWAVFF